MQYIQGWDNSISLLSRFVVNAIQQVNAFWYNSCKKWMTIFCHTGTSVGTVVGLSFYGFIASIPIISHDLAAVFQSFFEVFCCYPTATSCLQNRLILPNFLSSCCLLRPSGHWYLKSLANILHPRPKPKWLTQLRMKQWDPTRLQPLCVLLLQDPPVTEPLLNVRESAPSSASSWATQIPATKQIRLALVFFACLFLLILLSTASWKGEKNSLAHFLIHILQIPHWQPLFLVGI